MSGLGGGSADFLDWVFNNIYGCLAIRLLDTEESYS